MAVEGVVSVAFPVVTRIPAVHLVSMACKSGAAFHEKAGLCQCILSVQEGLFTTAYPSSLYPFSRMRR
jgi:hypothetical protein